ncbi:MAG TPA: hypothetical protein VN723_08155 [Rhizomicrobium sp.]|jgi:hypothetical protein|nr:hypothetical protein [Rhizomicrobium sp.]
MDLLGSFSGKGQLVQGGSDLGAVGYEYNVYDAEGGAVGTGFLAGEPGLFVKAAALSDLSLRLADGQEMPIEITKTVGNDAEFDTPGPIPGY